MERTLRDQLLIDEVIETFTVPNFRRQCPTCERGAASLPMPDNEDLTALYEIIQGFDMRRLSFTPEMEHRIRRAKFILGYLNSMIAGQR